MGLKIFLNGKFVEKENACVSVFDHGVLYGDGVFEGIRSYNRRVFKLDEHIDRLYRGAAAISLEIPITKEAFKSKVIETLKLNDLGDAYIRAVVTRGAGDLGLDPRKCPAPTIFIITDTIELYPEELYEKGLPIVTSKVRRNHPTTLDPRIKSLNYLNNILAKIDAINGGTEEALMLSIEGYVAECSGDNILLVRDGKLFTPLAEMGALEGVTQDTVIDMAKNMGIDTEFKNILPEEVLQADECFLTGTAAEIIPVVDLDGKKIGSGEPGEMTHRLRQEYKKLTQSEGTEY
ncbi:MAG: branched-chain-amino-acid transaminase [Candidatus Tantalella remota]|nr:branched-chain-amino-acid transaminase [Candidatus Tantalella remota]